MQGKGAPQSVNQITLTRKEIIDVGLMINLGQTEPLKPYDDIVGGVYNPTAHKFNYMDLRFEGFSHREALDLSLELDIQFNFNDRKGRLNEQDSREINGHSTWTHISYGEYLNIGIVNGKLLAMLLKAGGSTSEVIEIQRAISKVHPFQTKLQRQERIVKFIDLRPRVDNPLTYEAVEAEAISHVPVS